MEENDLIELKKYQLEILKVVTEFCVKHNIKYFMSEGSLLGVVRHNGFIPWDDDIDIAMPREDYNRFKEIFEKKFPKGYQLENNTTIYKFWLSFSKVRMARETGFYTYGLEKRQKYSGPRIDIFPLDYLPKYGFLQKITAYKVKIYKKILWFSGLDYKKPKRKKQIPLYILSKIMPNKFICYRLNKLMTKYIKKEHKFIVNYASSYSVEKEIFPVSYFDTLIERNFEDIKVMIPSKFDEILKKIYGNYMKLPDIENRNIKHGIYKKKEL